MQQYLDLLHHIKTSGTTAHNRTGIDTLRVFGKHLHFDLRAGFPLLTTKKLHFHSILHELLWFISGSTNIEYLNKNSVKIWDLWADEQGELGPVYGSQWRSWQCSDGRTIDQLSEVIKRVQTDPDSRRLLVSAWNVGEIDKMALPPCHLLFQFFVDGDYLSCQMYQRSADLFIGVPFNIASYALLTCMVAHVTNLKPADLHIAFGYVHIYTNHIEQVNVQLERKPKPLPLLQINPKKNDFFSLCYDDFSLLDYRTHPHIPAPVAK